MAHRMVYDDLVKLLSSKERTHGWLRDRGLLGQFGGLCERCGVGHMFIRKDKSFRNDGCVWRCLSKDCHMKVSIQRGSWFAKSNLSIDVIHKMTYYWVYNCTNEYVREELRLGSKHTVVDWFNFGREVCGEILERENVLVGGPGRIVEIDESKFGQRKYHRGRRVDGV